MNGRFMTQVSFLLMAVAVSAGAGAAAGRQVTPPPNAPARVEYDQASGALDLHYHGRRILGATVEAQTSDGTKVPGAVKMETSVAPGEKVEQRLKFVPLKPQQGVNLVLRGTVTGSAEAFPAETLSEAQERFPYVRNSVGLSRNLRNNAVYDRRWDWVLIGPPDGATRIEPTVVEKQQIAFSWESRGSDLEVVFRPRFYQKHKELKYFEPWTYKVWKGSVTGFCSWWSYRDGFNQKVLDEIVDVFSAKHLPDFGYRYLQIDACYQSGGGTPQGFLNWNNRFPGGADHAVRKTRSAGMEAGLWVFCVFNESDPLVRESVNQHPEWFVREPDGKARRFLNPWTGGWWYALDTTDEEALDRLVRPTYRGLKKQGFTYVKIDGAGDLVDWGYCKSPEYFKEKGVTPGDALRRFYQAARDELGRDIYILACWGVLPELIGVADGCRLATDGFRAASFQGFNSWEGVVWRNDPDHCDILPVGRKDYSVMKTFAVNDAPLDTIIRPSVISMAGGVLLLSDKAEVYKEDRNLEGVKRSSPVLFTVPGQLYDYTPRGPRWFFRNHARAGGGESRWWFSEIDRPFDHWSVLARFNWRQKNLEWKRPGAPQQEIKFADLGLSDDREYLVFEFWSQKFLGKSRGSFTAPAQDTNNGLQVFAIREARPHPWVISTSRHISQGGVSLLDVKWNGRNKILSGSSSVVKGDPYVMTIHLPEGFRLKAAEADGEKAETENLGHTGTVRMTPSATGTVNWRIAFAK